MKVWIGCLACYNGGDLIGRWVNADACPQDVTEFDSLMESAMPDNAKCCALPADHRTEGHEELWIFDTDEAPHASLAREMGVTEAAEIGERISELENEGIDPDVFAAWANHVGEGFLTADASDFEEAFCGEWSSREDYAMDLAEDLGAMPKEHSWPASYIDWESAARDLFMDYFDIDSPRGIYVFRSY